MFVIANLTSPKSTPLELEATVDLISDALAFGRLWYGEPNASGNAVGYGSFAVAHMML